MTRTILIAALLTMGSAAVATAGCRAHSDQAMSCADGSSWDSATQTCVPQTSS